MVGAIAKGLAQVRMGYQDGLNVGDLTKDASIDRARGGIIKIKLVIPEYSGRTTGRDREPFTIPERTCEFEIDLEKLPLVNVSSYAIDRTQDGPATLSYPYGDDKPDGDASNVYGSTFS